MKSSFKSDLFKEQLLQPLLDAHYQGLEQYTFERVSNLKQQKEGIDLILIDKRDGGRYFIDEKAQLDYINESLPTFAFEIQYKKQGGYKPGWLFDNSKKTHFYALATSIFSDEDGKLTSCKLTFVNREKLLQVLGKKGLSAPKLIDRLQAKQSGKLIIDELHPKKEGYLFLSNKKAESPLNLILKLDWLIDQKIAKNFP